MLQRLYENRRSNCSRKTPKICQSSRIISVCLLSTDRQKFTRFTNVHNLNGEAIRNELTNHLCSIASFYRETLNGLHTMPSKDISDRAGFRFANGLEDYLTIGVDQADSSVCMTSIETDPVVLISQKTCSITANIYSFGYKREYDVTTGKHPSPRDSGAGIRRGR